MYLLLNDDKRVREIIPESHPAFPGVPIEERYPAALVAKLIHVEDGVEVGEGYRYDEETGAWSYADPTPASSEPEPTWAELAEAIQEGVDSV